MNKNYKDPSLVDIASTLTTFVKIELKYLILF